VLQLTGSRGGRGEHRGGSPMSVSVELGGERSRPPLPRPSVSGVLPVPSGGRAPSQSGRSQAGGSRDPRLRVPPFSAGPQAAAPPPSRQASVGSATGVALRVPRRAPVSQAVPGSAGNRRAGPRTGGSNSSYAPASSSHMQWEVVETDHKRFRDYLHAWVQASGYSDLVTAQGEVPSVSGRRRVDNVLYVGRGSQRRYIVVEFDKEQHKGYSIDRDVKLMQEWYMDRLAVLWPQGATLDVVRWNPNSYSHADGQLGEADTPARLEKLQTVLCELLDGAQLHPGTMVVHYLYSHVRSVEEVPAGLRAGRGRLGVVRRQRRAHVYGAPVGRGRAGRRLGECE
jgi:hypothetical protein